MTDAHDLERALDVLARHPLVDGHNDLPYALRTLVGSAVDHRHLARLDLRRRQPHTHTDLERLTAGRLSAQFWSVYVPTGQPETDAVAQTLEQIDAVRAMVRCYPDRLALTATAAGVLAAFEAGLVASLIGAEGGHCIAGSLGILRMFRELGVRYLTLTHDANTAWADSATDVERLGGLSDFGREVVREMNRIGVIVDLSHVSVGTMRDALAATEVPVLFSHSSARTVCNHVRNVPDDVLAALRVNGGVCMVTFVPAFVSERRRAWEAELATVAASAGDETDVAARRLGPPPPVTVAEIADHVEHVRDVAGIDHVGIGGDFDGCDTMPAEVCDVSCYPLLFAELVARGWSESELAKLAGANALRVLRAAEEVESAWASALPPI
jgi:membrane dipeptidase